MKIHSIKFKFTILMAAIVAALIVLLLVINMLFSEKIYMSSKQNSMIKSFDKVDEILEDYYNSNISQDTMLTKMENATIAKGISALVVDSSWDTIYCSSQGNGFLSERLRMSIFNGDIFKDKPRIPNEEQDKNIDSNNQKHNKKYDDRIDMMDNSLVENREIIENNNKYTLQKVFDSRLEDDYLEIWGTLESGYSVILRTPIQSVKDNVKISNSLIQYCGVGILIIGIIIVFIFSNIITKPIKQISNIAERMSELDFDVKYTGKDKGEVGLLGKSMNNMSEKLEENITQLKNANLELRRDIDKKEKLEQMRTDFLSNVSHELKTPIALIQGYAEGLKEGITDDPESMDYYCEVIIDEANKMNDMVKRLLTLNQIEFGKNELIMERFDINSLISSVVDANIIRAEQSNLGLVFDNRNEHCNVWADEYRVEEVITNYISNAINHCDGKKPIEISVEHSGDIAKVSVYNSGKNIPEEDIDRIWEKFYKVDKAHTREYGGNGIGLSIVKAIIESMGQQCGVENVSDGVVFWFNLDCKS